MTILSLDAVDKVDRDGTLVGGTYTAQESLDALNTHRYEVFRYEQHRVVAGVWTVLADITDKIGDCTIKYNRWQTGSMRTADFTLVDDPVFGTTINDLGDAIRCFRLVRMPDGNYAQWMRGTFYVPSPEVPLQPLSQATLHAPDALWNLVNAKLDDWLTVPASADMATFWGHTDDLDDPIEWVRSLIAYYVPLAGVDIDDDPDEKRVTASQPLSYRPGDALLDVINDLLYYAGFDQLVANVTGSYISQPFVPPSQLNTEISYIATSPTLEPQAGCFLVRKSWKWKRNNIEAFNKWTGVVSGADIDFAYTKELTDPANPLSTANRGIVHQFFYSKAPDAATLQAQVEAKYEEGQRVLATLDGQIAAVPHDHRDKIALSWPTQQWGPLADATYIVKGWEEPMKAGAGMTLHLEQAPLTAYDLGAPSPRVAHLRLTEYAPTIAVTDNVTATPGVVALSTTRSAPQLQQTVSPPLATLTVSTFAPDVVSGLRVTPDLIALTTVTFAPVVAVTLNQTATPGLATLTLATFAPTLGGDDMTQIAQTILGSDTATIDFSSIPATYRDLIIIGQIRTDNSTEEDLKIVINSDAGTNYDARLSIFYATTSTAGVSSTATATAKVARVPGADAASGDAAAIRIHLPNYAATTFRKSWLSENSHRDGSNIITVIGSGLWLSTSAITAITISTTTGGKKMLTGSVLTLYGVGT